jgi:hypothetical protein
VATVTAGGIVTAVGRGVATISASVDAVTGRAGVAVYVPIAAVTIDLGDQEVVAGGAVQFAAQPRDSAGRPLLGHAVAWSITDTAVATLAMVAGDAVVTGRAPGATTLTATVENRQAVVAVTVSRVRFTGVWAAESNHTCGLTAAGAVYCWGSDELGQLGNGVAPSSAAASRVGLVLSAGLVSPGGRFTCALASDGHPYCWGSGASGRLGNGSDDDSQSPVAALSAHPFSELSSGWGLTCGIADGVAYCWGNAGALGSDTLKFSAVPLPIGGEVSLRAAGVGNRYACALASDAMAYCWGMNLDGRLGRSDVDYSDTPLAVTGGLAFDTLVAGPMHACALSAAGVAYCWGGDAAGQLGNGAAPGGATPTPVAGGLAFRMLSAGNAHTCGLTADGSAWCWGSNPDGRLGVSPGVESCGGVPCSTTPVAVSGDLRFTTISAGGSHTCGIATDGVVYCWGANGDGQLGNGTFVASALPARVVGQP